MSKIIVGTSNPGKIREIASILSPLGYEIEPHALDVQETGKTIKDNAILKATVYSKEYPDTYVIAEDSGLVVPGQNMTDLTMRNCYNISKRFHLMNDLHILKYVLQ